MAKKGKGKGNKPVSARGHREESTLRFRLEQDLVRIDRNGRPLTSSIPFNVMSKDFLTQSAPAAPPVDHSKTPPPSNVSSFAEHKAKRDSTKPKRHRAVGQPHGWLHNKALAMNEFKGWSRITKEIGRGPSACEPWTEDKDKKLYSPSLDRQRELSKAGHNKPKKPKAVTTPPKVDKDIKFKPLDPKFYMPPKVTGSAGLSPSGLPIRLFTEGKYKPKEKPVVYTNSQQESPPTPTRDWRAGAVNDNRYDNAVNAWSIATHSHVQWFINHVEPQNWPNSVHNFVHWKPGGFIVNTGAINEAASHPETELLLVKSLHEGLEKDWRMLDDALGEANQEVSLLKQELQATRNEVKLLEYDLAHRTGDQQSVGEIRQEIKVSNAKPPENADTMLFEFRLFKTFVRTEGEAKAFARFVYNDPGLGKVMEDQADMRFKERESELHYRNFTRFLKDFAAYHKKAQDKLYVHWWEDEYPKYLKRVARRNDTAVMDVANESAVFKGWSYATKQRDSIYYSSLKQAPLPSVSCINSIKARAILKEVGYRKYRQPHVNTVSKYVKWWEENLPRAELKYAVITQPVKAAVVSSYNKLMDVMNTDVNPFERKRKKEWINNYQREQDELREQRLERKAKAKQEKAERDHIRKMQRLAH